MKTLSCQISFDCSPTAMLVYTMCSGQESNDHLFFDRDIHIVVIWKCIVHVVMCLEKYINYKTAIETVPSLNQTVDKW